MGLTDHGIWFWASCGIVRDSCKLWITQRSLVNQMRKVCSRSQSVTPRPAEPALPGKLWEIQTIRPYPRSNKPKTLGFGPRNMCFSKFYRFFGCTLEFENYCQKTLPTLVELVVKNSSVSAGDIRGSSWIPGSGRSPGHGHGNPLKCSCLKNPMDRGAWWARVQRVTKNQTQLNRLSTHTCTHIPTHINIGESHI